MILSQWVAMNRLTDFEKIFVGLVDRHLDGVYRYLFNLTHNEDQARDLSHETFLRLRQQVFRGMEISEAYVFTTARNSALSQWRSDRREETKREVWGLEPPSSADSSSLVENSELQSALRYALGVLSEDQRSVFLLSEIEGLKYVQIAEVLGISPGTVASRKFKANRVLRGELKRMGHEL